ncbi:MAG: adenine deaminase [Bacteroidetes bacterium]|nr:adenine deaminase [Bacteroidota bacterium]
MKNYFSVSGHIIDVVTGRIFDGTVFAENGRIIRIEETSNVPDQYIIPGLIDAHIHIESSMLVPSEFARIAVTHGTVATVSDPHEIANVLGIPGIMFMIENGKKTPFKFFFGASSCVPATGFESSGAILGPDEVRKLLEMPEIHYLSEMMNYPGVISQDAEVMNKINIAHGLDKPVDGHAPGLMGEDARKYIAAGISTDHECYMIEEAREKVALGMKILIREGSAAKNFNELIPLLAENPEMVMFCSDDRHPDDLVKEHINSHVKRALNMGYNPIDVLRAASLNPVKHYKLDAGLLQPGDPADFIVVDNLQEFNILKTYINGEKVSENGVSLLTSIQTEPINNFNAQRIKTEDFQLQATGDHIRVIQAIDGQLITGSLESKAIRNGDFAESSPMDDILKIAVINRYDPAIPAIGFIKGFGLKEGAIASSVAHDSHNIIVTGATDEAMAEAANLLIEHKGGIAAIGKDFKHILPLPVAGLMSDKDGYQVASDYELADKQAKKLGSELHAPYMTLSFMALLVIPQLKLSDKGLFDAKNFRFTKIFS